MERVVQPEDVEDCLTRILTSSSFSGSAGLQKFLSYVVRETLAGRGNEIKAYTIGVDALGKPENFDSQTDAAVRVMARRVRDSLDLYYAQEGAEDPVRIEIPVGSYRPEISYVSGDPDAQTASSTPNGMVTAAEFKNSGTASQVTTKTPSFPSQKSVLALCLIGLLVIAGIVAWFSAWAEPDANVAVNRIRVAVQSSNITPAAEGARLAADLAGALSRNKSFAVMQSGGEGLDFVIRTAVIGAGAERRASVTLVNAHTNTLVWNRNYPITMPSAEAADYDQTVLRINRELLTQLFGASVTALEGRDPNTLTASQLFVMATWVPGPAKSSLAWEVERVGLARLALQKDPNHGPAYSVLADKLSYLAAVDGSLDTQAAAQEARRSALKAIELSPADVNVAFNVAQHYWHSGEVRTAVRWMERTLEIDPSHAFARFFRTVIPYTCAPAPDAVLAQAVNFDESLAQDNPIRWVTQTWLGWLHLNRGELAEALRDEQKAASIFEIPYTIMRHAAVLNAMGRTKEAAELIKSKRANWPNLSPRFFADVTMPRLCMKMDGGVEMLRYYRALANETESLLQ